MTKKPINDDGVRTGMDEIYAETGHWTVNAGNETIHAKRILGRWRRIKWFSSSVWLVFFLGPYVTLDGHQAVLFDIPNRQYHLFGVTVLPQDFWMLSLLLLFFAVLLAVATVLAGRVYCGFFCFQTVWTDVFTWIEERFEGIPQQRRQLDQAPMTFAKAKIKAAKHLVWLVIGFATGFSFVAWFYGAAPLWRDFFIGAANGAVYVTVALFTLGTYLLAGWLREQVCFWLCPYARIQGVMLDRASVVPAYDAGRGEPRGRVQKNEIQDDAGGGDCVDCNQCVAVCPTGIDIREGQQEGCITCALCIDACDMVMDKLKRPRGLIRYASLDELEGRPVKPMLARVRVWIYGAILILAVIGIVHGLSSLAVIELKVLHERAPLFVRLSDGSIQNKYTLKVLNKSNHDLQVRITASSDVPIELIGADELPRVTHGHVAPIHVFVRIKRTNLTDTNIPIDFRAEARLPDGTDVSTQRESAFFSPAP